MPPGLTSPASTAFVRRPPCSRASQPSIQAPRASSVCHALHDGAGARKQRLLDWATACLLACTMARENRRRAKAGLFGGAQRQRLPDRPTGLFGGGAQRQRLPARPTGVFGDCLPAGLGCMAARKSNAACLLSCLAARKSSACQTAQHCLPVGLARRPAARENSACGRRCFRASLR